MLRLEFGSAKLEETDIRKSRFWEAQIKGVLRKQEAGGAMA
jgi:hypothetical protein